jgi:hypothetical protein
MASMVKKAAAGTVLGGSLLFVGGLGVANAAPPVHQDGLVNLSVGNVTVLKQVGIGVAANVAAEICDVTVPVNVLGEQIRAGQDQTVCTIDPQGANVPITITA